MQKNNDEIIESKNNVKLFNKKIKQVKEQIIGKRERTPWKKMSKIIEDNLTMADNENDLSTAPLQHEQQEQKENQEQISRNVRVSTQISTRVSSSCEMPKFDNYYISESATSSSASPPGPGPIPWPPNTCEQPKTPPLPSTSTSLLPPPSAPPLIIRKKKKDKIKKKKSTTSSCSSSKTPPPPQSLSFNQNNLAPSSPSSPETASTSPTISTREVSFNGTIQTFNILSKTQAVKKGYSVNKDDFIKKKKEKKIIIVNKKRKRKTIDDDKKRQKLLTDDVVVEPEVVKLPIPKLCSCENTECNENICVNRERLNVTLSLPPVADLPDVTNDVVELLQIPINDSSDNKILISMNVNQVVSTIEDKELNTNENVDDSQPKPLVKAVEILPKGSIKFANKKIPVKKRGNDEKVNEIEFSDNDKNTNGNLTEIKLTDNDNVDNCLSKKDIKNNYNKLTIENEENQGEKKIGRRHSVLDDGRLSRCSRTSISEKALSVDLEKLTPNIIEHYQRKSSGMSTDMTNKITAERNVSISSCATDKTVPTTPPNENPSKIKRFSPIRFDKSSADKKFIIKTTDTDKLHTFNEPKNLMIKNNSVDDNNVKESVINNVAGSQIINNEKTKRKIETDIKSPSPKRFKFDRKRQKEDDDDEEEEGSSESSLNKLKKNSSSRSLSKSPIAAVKTTAGTKVQDDFIMKWLNKDIDNSVIENNNNTVDKDKMITNDDKSVSPKLTKNNLQLFTVNNEVKQNEDASVDQTQLVDEILDYHEDGLTDDELQPTEKLSVGSTKVIDNLSVTSNKKLSASSSSSDNYKLEIDDKLSSSSSSHSCCPTDCSCDAGSTTKLQNKTSSNLLKDNIEKPNNAMSFDQDITDTEDLQLSEKLDDKSVKDKLNNQDNDDEISLFGGDIDDIETEDNNDDEKKTTPISIATMSNHSNDDDNYKKMHLNNIDPFIEHNNAEFNQVFDEYEMNQNQINTIPINHHHHHNNNNRKLITFDNSNKSMINNNDNIDNKKTRINEYPPGVIKMFNGYCFGMLKRSRCPKISNCRFQHILEPKDELLNDEQPYVIKLRMDYAIFRGWHCYVTRVYENAIKNMDTTKLILELYNDIVDKFVDEINEPVYGLLAPTVIELAERKMPPVHIVNALIKTIKKDDSYKPKIIIKKIKNYIENGNYWITLRELILMLEQPPNEIIPSILNECLLGKVSIEQALDVQKNMMSKLPQEVTNTLNQSLIRSWSQLLKTIEDKYELNNLNDHKTIEKYDDKVEAPSIESPGSSTATIPQINLPPIMTGIKKRLGKLNKLLNNDNNNNNNHDEAAGAVDDNDEDDDDDKIDNVDFIESNNHHDDEHGYEIEIVDNVSKPVCIYQNQLFNFHNNLQIIRNELKKNNYKAVIQILNDVKINTNELSPFARGFYAILCKEIMTATHHLAEIIHLSVHKGNDVVKLLNLLIKVGNYLLVKLADTGAMGLAYQLVKTLQPYRIELSTSHIILTIEIYIANRHLLKALDLVKQHNLIFVRRSKMNPEEYAKLEYLRRPLINLLLKSLCKDYPKEAYYLFERLLKEQSSCCEPIDLRKHVHNVVASLVRHNNDDQLMSMGLLMLKHKVPIFISTLRIFVMKLFYINRYIAHQMYSYAIGLGAYSIIKVGTLTTMVIHTQWNEEEIYLRIHDLLENISNKLWHLIERPGPKEFSVYLTIEIVPSEFNKPTYTECNNKDIIDETKLRLLEVLDKFEPKIKMIEIDERIYKILDYSIVNYVKSNHSLV
ncbi:bromodomain-containing protein DDB_G0280777-like [Aphidius gifuensis]|uniref:bromodomain-containing protein DDB_G0280777-like n=1 Tax=Aphidius gifuensis TaxID=684658 RepID=UPI001CDD8E05|nr:bromodomain-containing protein DDB_G0280777-like [Aphidius gifuensis]